MKKAMRVFAQSILQRREIEAWTNQMVYQRSYLLSEPIFFSSFLNKNLLFLWSFVQVSRTFSLLVKFSSLLKNVLYRNTEREMAFYGLVTGLVKMFSLNNNSIIN